MRAERLHHLHVCIRVGYIPALLIDSLALLKETGQDDLIFYGSTMLFPRSLRFTLFSRLLITLAAHLRLTAFSQNH